MPRKSIYNTEEERKAAKAKSDKKYRDANRDVCIQRVSDAKKKRWQNDPEYRAARLADMKAYNAKKTLERQKKKYELLKTKFDNKD